MWKKEVIRKGALHGNYITLLHFGGICKIYRGFPGGLVKNPLANAGDVRDAGLISGLGRSPGGGHGNPLKYSCLENPMDRGDWGLCL